MALSLLWQMYMFKPKIHKLKPFCDALAIYKKIANFLNLSLLIVNVFETLRPNLAYKCFYLEYYLSTLQVNDFKP